MEGVEGMGMGEYRLLVEGVVGRDEMGEWCGVMLGVLAASSSYACSVVDGCVRGDMMMYALERTVGMGCRGGGARVG